MSHRRIGVVMAGGAGERFWPLSRPDRPKQVLRLVHPESSMLDEALERIRPVVHDLFVSTSQGLRDVISASSGLPTGQVLAEPAKRNTLGAVCWVLASLLSQGIEDASLALVSADHRIGDHDAFQACVEAAMEVAEGHEGIVTFGVPPSRPETGYGYIEVGDDEPVVASNGKQGLRAVSFREKPSPETAEEYLASGRFLWNAGMFFTTQATLMSELAAVQPDAHRAVLEIAWALARSDADGARRAFEQLPNLSVDYAVMERAQHVFTIRADFEWDDVGAWDAIARAFPPDERGNVVRGAAVLLESRGSVVVNESEGMVAGVLGVEDMVVVVTDDAVLVVPKRLAQRVRFIPQAIQRREAGL